MTPARLLCLSSRDKAMDFPAATWKHLAHREMSASAAAAAGKEKSCRTLLLDDNGRDLEAD
jgi:hypothetical protein